MQDIARMIFGPFITVSTCSGSKNTARMMYRRFHGICENMEGAAFAHICALYEVPIIEIRGISNIVGDRNNWEKDEASSRCQRMVSELVRRIHI
jgi:futalosine hydrolase